MTVVMLQGFYKIAGNFGFCILAYEHSGISLDMYSIPTKSMIGNKLWF